MGFYGMGRRVVRYLLTVDENGDSIDFVVTLNVGVVVVLELR